MNERLKKKKKKSLSRATQWVPQFDGSEWLSFNHVGPTMLVVLRVSQLRITANRNAQVLTVIHAFQFNVIRNPPTNQISTIGAYN